jgi:hypothetical protein
MPVVRATAPSVMGRDGEFNSSAFRRPEISRQESSSSGARRRTRDPPTKTYITSFLVGSLGRGCLHGKIC